MAVRTSRYDLHEDEDWRTCPCYTWASVAKDADTRRGHHKDCDGTGKRWDAKTPLMPPSSPQKPVQDEQVAKLESALAKMKAKPPAKPAKSEQPEKTSLKNLAKPVPPPPMPHEEKAQRYGHAKLHQELTLLLDRYGIDKECNTDSSVLSVYMMSCLASFVMAVQERARTGGM